MKAMFWFLLLIVALLAAVLFLRFANERQKQARPLPVEVSADSIGAYQARLAELKEQLNRLQLRAAQSPPLEKMRLERKLQVLSTRIRDLEVAIEQWRSARSPNAAGNLYRSCLLLYGKASGVCDVLAQETLPVKVPER